MFRCDFFKIVADRLILESGARPIYIVMLPMLLLIILQLKELLLKVSPGRQAILADRVIDCTGDADIAFFSGVSSNSLQDSALLLYLVAQV